MEQTRRKSIKELLGMTSEEVLEYVLSLPAEEQKPLKDELLQAQATRKTEQENLSNEIQKALDEASSLQDMIAVAEKYNLKLNSVQFPKKSGDEP